ncbi:MAG: glycosyltransferase family 39 protein [Rhodobacteraceae bacterium]|nr:glycosyltransferase family 39 protein [Paracoccaceae bacterium]
MPSPGPGADPAAPAGGGRAAARGDGWLRPALLIVGAVTALRLLVLWLSPTDLYVDESQYWVWGQNPDWGYYSKPPLIAWVIRATTWLAGADTPFTVRLAAPAFHAATALILAALARSLGGRRAAVWTAAAYVTMPFASLGSAVISTDTIMAPFLAGALAFAWRTGGSGRRGDALAAGLLLGLALMAKYAAIYVLAGLALAQIAVPERRIGRGNAAILVLAALAVVAPNLLWNLGHGLATVRHTADNIGWLGADGPGPQPSLASLAAFVAGQFAVFGPVLLPVLLLRLGRRGTPAETWLACFVLPVLVLVALQALLLRANANWTVPAYIPGTVLVVLALARRPRLLALGVGVNAALGAVVLGLFLAAPFPAGPDGRPVLWRYLGAADFSRAVIAEARARGLATVVSDRREVLADLFFTGAGSGLAFHALPPAGRPQDYFQQMFPLPAAASGPVLAALSSPPDCGAGPLAPVASPPTTGGAFAKWAPALYVMEAACARQLSH